MTYDCFEDGRKITGPVFSPTSTGAVEEAERRFPILDGERVTTFTGRYGASPKTAREIFLAAATWQASQSALSPSERAETLAVLEPFSSLDGVWVWSQQSNVPGYIPPSISVRDVRAARDLAARLRSAPSDGCCEGFKMSKKFCLHCPRHPDNAPAPSESLKWCPPMARYCDCEPRCPSEEDDVFIDADGYRHIITPAPSEAAPPEPAQGEVLVHQRCPTCNLNWWLHAPAKIHGEQKWRCVECKAVYGPETVSASGYILPPAGDTVAVKREWLEDILERASGISDAMHAELRRLLDGRQP